MAGDLLVIHLSEERSNSGCTFCGKENAPPIELNPGYATVFQDMLAQYIVPFLLRSAVNASNIGKKRKFELREMHFGKSTECDISLITATMQNVTLIRFVNIEVLLLAIVLALVQGIIILVKVLQYVFGVVFNYVYQDF